MEYYSAVTKMEILQYVTICMNLEIIQSQEDKY